MAAHDRKMKEFTHRIDYVNDEGERGCMLVPGIELANELMDRIEAETDDAVEAFGFVTEATLKDRAGDGVVRRFES